MISNLIWCIGDQDEKDTENEVEYKSKLAAPFQSDANYLTSS